MTFGVTTDGFIKKRFEDLVAELETEFKAQYGTINTSEEAVAGQLIRIMAKETSDLWELLEAIYNSQYPATADGVSLDNVSDIVGIQRLAATNSFVVLSCYANQGTVLTTGRIVQVPSTLVQFQTVAAVTVDANTAINDAVISVGTVADSINYTLVINANVYTINSGVGATAASIIAALKVAVDAGAEPLTFTDNLDGTARLLASNDLVPFSLSVTVNLSINTLSSPVVASSVLTGQQVGLAGTVTGIVTPVAGWNSVTNRLDAVLGRELESDTALRLRRAQSLQVAGYATADAIHARVLQVAGVTGVNVVENRSTVTDGDGRPAKSYEVVVLGGADADIAKVIWESKPAGIETYGSTGVVVKDVQGTDQTVYFSRATSIYVWIKVTITKYTEEDFPANGVQDILTNVLAYAVTNHDINVDVIAQRFIGQVFLTPGIATVLVELATSVAPAGPPGAYSSANLTISSTQLAVFDSTRLSVVEL